MTLDNGFCFDKSGIKAAMDFDPKQDPGPIRCFYFNKFKYYLSSPHARFKYDTNIRPLFFRCVVVAQPYPSPSYRTSNRLIRYGKSNKGGKSEQLADKMNPDHHDRTILNYHKHTATIDKLYNDFVH